ncbi:hypothetical protein BVX94_02650 [bacterium B17]|nr:hypothetical protein BVX94_02650 [bacterium B17]
MKILLLAPHPFYQERGTPIAVDLLIRALSDLGHEVDVLTYHEGEDLKYSDRVAIKRIKKPPFAEGIRPGFSFKKLISDFYMFPEAKRMARENKYDMIHAVEESVFMARSIGRKLKIPYVFDMDSSMPEQIVEKFCWAKFMLPMMNGFEARAVKSAEAVVPVCQALADKAEKHGAKRIFLLRDISLLGKSEGADVDIRAELGIKGPMVLYIGNLEKYQGIDLLIESFKIVHGENDSASLVIIGGKKNDVMKYMDKTMKLGLEDSVHLVGPRPVSHMKALLESADVLVSPRTKGGNTPMKIYSYMDSGKALLATSLETHTQVLDDSTAMLAKPEKEPFAKAMKQLLEDAELRNRLGSACKHAAEERHSPDAFRKTVKEIYAALEGRSN